MELSQALASSQTALLAGQLSGGFVRLFSGVAPTSPDRAETGTLLGIVSVGGLSGAGLHFQASGAALSKADEPWVFHALAGGTVGWFRVVQAGDTGADDLAALRIDGTVGTNDAPGDMNWQTLTIASGAAYTLDAFLYLIQPIGH